MLLTAIYNTDGSRGYHIGANESAKYGFLYQVEVANGNTSKQGGCRSVKPAVIFAAQIYWFNIFVEII
ncbi:hypothetical protein O9993_03180 [Vibrio lentus]|nr:hypothetical protein [Vibrio lentus]